MKALWRLLPSVAVLALLSGLADAQERKKRTEAQPEQRGRGAGALGLLEIADVRKDLKLSEEQVNKIKALVEKQGELRKGITSREDVQKLREQMQAQSRAMSEVLTKKQTQRLRQLELQQRGLDFQTLRELGVDREQAGKIREALTPDREKLGEIRKAGRGDREAMQKKLAEIHKEVQQAALKLLTAEQRKKWQEMVGEPFAGTLPPAGLFPGVGRERPSPEGRPDQPPRRKRD